MPGKPGGADAASCAKAGWPAGPAMSLAVLRRILRRMRYRRRWSEAVTVARHEADRATLRHDNEMAWGRGTRPSPRKRRWPF